LRFLDLTSGGLPLVQSRKPLELCWHVEKLAGAAEIARAAPSRKFHGVTELT
jgi:hypothetical protein